MSQPPGEGILFISKKYFKDKRMNFFKGILSGLLSLIKIDEALAILPGLFEPVISELVDKNLSPEEIEKVREYLFIADKAGEAVLLITEILSDILEKRPVSKDKLERLKRWAIPASYREG